MRIFHHYRVIVIVSIAAASCHAVEPFVETFDGNGPFDSTNGGNLTGFNSEGWFAVGSGSLGDGYRFGSDGPGDGGAFWKETSGSGSFVHRVEIKEFVMPPILAEDSPADSGSSVFLWHDFHSDTQNGIYMNLSRTVGHEDDRPGLTLRVNEKNERIPEIDLGDNIAMEMRFDQPKLEVTFGYDNDIYDDKPIDLFGPYSYDGKISEPFVQLSIGEDERGEGDIRGRLTLWSLTESFDGLGDIDENGRLDASDIDNLTAAIAAEEFDDNYDLNFDGSLTNADRTLWISRIMKTSLGDADLDGRFNNQDFVLVFQAAEYEDAIDRNSTWAEGDWNGDLEFDSRDFVAAFSTARYELGNQAGHGVPESCTNGLWLLLCTVLYRSITQSRLQNDRTLLR